MRSSFLYLLLLIMPVYGMAASLTIGSGLNAPPYIIQEDESGLELDIVRAALKAEGIDVDFKFYSHKRQTVLYQKDQLDALLTKTLLSGVNGHWSDSYIDYHYAAITLASRQLQVNTINDLKHLSVAAFDGATQLLGGKFSDVAYQTIYREMHEPASQNRMLYFNRIDTVVAERYIFTGLNSTVESDIDTNQAIVYHDIFLPVPYQIVFHNSAARNSFNQGLAKIKSNGVYDALIKKYLLKKQVK